MKVEQVKEFLEALGGHYNNPVAQGLAGIAGDTYLSALSDVRYLRKVREATPEGKMPQVLEVFIMEKMLETMFNLLGTADRFEEEASRVQVH